MLVVNGPIAKEVGLNGGSALGPGKENEINILEEISFPDHYNYSRTDLDNLIKKAKQKNSILLTTEKDYFRIDKDYRASIDCLKIKVKIEKENEFIEEIKKVI